MRRYQISDQAWERVRNLLPGKSTNVERTAKDNRLFLTARSGWPVAVYPEEFFLSAMEPGTLSTDASAAGRRKVYGNSNLRPCGNQTWIGLCSI